MCKNSEGSGEAVWMHSGSPDSSLFNFIIIQPPHDKTSNMTFAPSEDSDQPGHSRFFAVHMKKQ